MEKEIKFTDDEVKQINDLRMRVLAESEWMILSKAPLKTGEK